MRYLAILTLAVCSVGCTSLETAAKMGARFALDAAQVALEEKIGEEGAKIIESVKEWSDKGIEKATDIAAEKTAHATDGLARIVMGKAGLEPGRYDWDDNGIFDEREVDAILRDAKEKGGFGGTFWAIVLLSIFQVGKSAKRRWLPNGLNGNGNGSVTIQ